MPISLFIILSPLIKLSKKINKYIYSPLSSRAGGICFHEQHSLITITSGNLPKPCPSYLSMESISQYHFILQCLLRFLQPISVIQIFSNMEKKPRPFLVIKRKQTRSTSLSLCLSLAVVQADPFQDPLLQTCFSIPGTLYHLKKIQSSVLQTLCSSMPLCSMSLYPNI